VINLVETAAAVTRGWNCEEGVKIDDEEQEKIDRLNKSYESLGENEKDELHYNIDSDAEPPHDEVGDVMTVVQKRQVTKRILKVGEDLGKPGRPYVVSVTITGFFAKPMPGGEKARKRMEDRCIVGDVFWKTDGPISIKLGDPLIPFGLWRSIEQMRKGETARVMIKPPSAYAKEFHAHAIEFPEGWKENAELKE
jgi:FKBP-type peptidyl-prolyl cis-trans isomerase